MAVASVITLADMALVARALTDAEKATEEAETALKDAKERERRIREETIPCAMQELQLKYLELDDGSAIVVSDDVYASVAGGKQEAACSWLTEHGFGGMVSLAVVAAFDKKDEKKALKLFETTVKKHPNTSLAQAVNTGTLKAWLREQIAKGAQIPLDLFGARPVWTTKIKTATKGKKK